MMAFGEDLKRWMDQGYRPVAASRSPLKLGPIDLIRLAWRHPAVLATAMYRMSHWCSVHRIRILPSLLERLNLLLFGLEISSSVPIGPGLYIAHPVGTVIMARKIGANATFVHAITVGMRNSWDFPVIGDGVFVGAGARILGDIELADNCTIGANAVVIDSVAAGITAVGVPARPLLRRSNARSSEQQTAV